MNIFFFSRSDIIAKKKSYLRKSKKAKSVNKNSIVLYAILCKMYSVKLVLHSIHWKSSDKSLQSLGKTFPGKKYFLDYVDSSSIGSRDKFIYAATAKTSPGNLLCYLPALLVDGLVCYFITHFLRNIRKNQKPEKSTRALLIECHFQLNVKKNQIIQQRSFMK